MRLHPTITLEQYTATCKAVLSIKPKPAYQYSWQQVAIGAVIGCGLVVGFEFRPARVAAVTVWVVVVLYAAACKPLIRRAQDKHYRRTYAEEQARLNDQVFTIDESGISCDQSNGKETSKYNWQAFATRVDLPDASIFLLSPNCFVRIPTDTLNPTDRELIEKWSASIPRRVPKQLTRAVYQPRP